MRTRVQINSVQYPPDKSAGGKARDIISHFVKNMKITVLVSHPAIYWDSWDDLSQQPGWSPINMRFDRDGFSFFESNGAYRQIDLNKEHFEDCVPAEVLEYGAVAIF